MVDVDLGLEMHTPNVGSGALEHDWRDVDGGDVGTEATSNRNRRRPNPAANIEGALAGPNVGEAE